MRERNSRISLFRVGLWIGCLSSFSQPAREALSVAANADAPLHESLNLERHAVSFRLTDKFAVNFENANLYNVFNRKVGQSLVANFSDELGGDFENPHFDKALKGFFIKTHLTHLTNKVRVYFENPR